MFDNYEFWSEQTALMIVIFVTAFAGSMAIRECWRRYQMEKHAKGKWREVPMAKFNESGMIMPSLSSLLSSRIEKVALVKNWHFPDDLAGFMGYLKPGEISTILLEIKTGPMTERKKDVQRAVTIAAAHYHFYVPHALLCLDARTHQLYNAFMNSMELMKPADKDILNMGMAPPARSYTEAALVAGHVLIHFALKGNYPSLVNFAKTVNKNLPKHQEYHVEQIQSFVTAYAFVTDMAIPWHYIRYNELTDGLVNNGLKDEKAVQELKPHLTLVK